MSWNIGSIEVKICWIKSEDRLLFFYSISVCFPNIPCKLLGLITVKAKGLCGVKIANNSCWNCFSISFLTHCFCVSLQFSTCPTKSLGWFQKVLCWLSLVFSSVALYGQQITLPPSPWHQLYFSSICCPPLFWMLDILCQIDCSLEILAPSFCMLSLGQSGMLLQLVYLSMGSI